MVFTLPLLTLLTLLFHRCASQDQLLRYRGRHYLGKHSGTKLVWSSTGVACHVHNTTSVQVSLTVPSHGVRLAVRLNDTVRVTRITVKKQKSEHPQQISLVDDLDPRFSHVVEFIRVTEASDGAMTFYGFVLDQNGVHRPTPPFSERRLEFIGDSDTAGWCVDGTPNGGDGDQNKIQDSTETWAGQIATALNVSDVQVEAVSGWGVTKHSTPIQPLLPYADGLHAKHLWDPSISWIPQGILVLIGPNDYNNLKHVPTDQTFIAKYTELLQYAETRYGRASVAQGVTPPIVIHVCGGSINGLLPCPNIFLASTAWNKNSTRVVKSAFVSISNATWKEINKGTRHFNGCDGHYNKEGHGLLMNDVVENVRKILNWP
jgi:lysophospholipase L1-like esterase